MTPWPAVPDLPGHVVETGRREDGARRRLDLFVHPEGLQPHHVAIRLDQWEGRAPELHAGFGAEARPVCLPEHVGPQEAAVGAAAGLVAQVAGAAAAVRLRGLWEAARGRLEDRIAELEAEGELARKVHLERHSTRLHLLSKPTRPSPFPSLRVGIASTDGALEPVLRPSPLLEPLTQESLAALPTLTAHQKLALLAAATTGIGALRLGFLTTLGFGTAVIDVGYPSRGRERALALREGWIGLRKDDWASDPDPDTFTLEVITPERDAIQIGVGSGSSPWATDRGLSIHARSAQRAALTISLGRRRRKDGAQLAPTFTRTHGMSDHDAAETDRLMRSVIYAFLMLDLDLSKVAARPVPHPGDADPSTHPLTAGIDIHETQRHVVAQLLGRTFEDYRAAAHRRFEKRAAGRRKEQA